MKTPLYRQALSHGWRVAWKHAWLWPFGMFAAFLGQMGLLDYLSHITLASSDYAVYPAWLSFPRLFSATTGGGAVSIGFEQWVWLFWLALLLFGIVALFVFTMVVSQGMIVHMSARASKRKSLPAIGPSWQVGITHFWRVLFLNMLKQAFLIGLALSVGYATLNMIQEPSMFDTFIFFSVFLLAGLVGIVASFLLVYAIGYVIVEEYRFVEAVRSAWRLFTSHWLVSMEVGLIILALNVFAVLVVFLGLFVLFFPTILLWFVSAVTGVTVLYTIGVFMGLSLFILFVAFVSSVFTIFSTSVWTFLFMKMHKHGIGSRVHHWLKAH
jgi:hypothetical protein